MEEDPLVSLRNSVFSPRGEYGEKANLASTTEHLLRFTIRRAFEHVKFYRHTIEQLGLSRRALSTFIIDDLERLPVLTKRDLVRNHFDLLADDVRLSTVTYTSGTTGPRALLYVCQEEIEAKLLFNRLVASQNGTTNEIQLREVFVASHGPDVPAYPVLTIPFTLDPSFPWSFEGTLAELRRTHMIRGRLQGPSALSINHRALRYLTAKLLSIGVRPASLGIKRVLNVGNYCSTPYRRFCRDFWGAKVFDTYSLAEVSGYATECDEHYLKHFSPFVIPEILDPATKRRLNGNATEGILVLTPLYPFQIAMPLIRYWTGDFARASWKSCRCGYRGLSIEKVLGRQEYCIDLAEYTSDQSPKRVIAVTDIIDELDSEVPFVVTGQDLKIHKLADLPPRFSIDLDRVDDDKISVRIIVEKFPRRNYRAMRAIGKKVANRLLARYADLWQERARELQFKVQVGAPGSIKDPFLKT